jgi:hypothetical protein
MTFDLEKVKEGLGHAGLSLPQWFLLTACVYGPKPQDSMLADALAEAEAILPGALGAADITGALRLCLDQGWIQVVDRAALGQLTSHLDAQGMIGPIYGLPQVGDIDFTGWGAQQARVLYPKLFGQALGVDQAFPVLLDDFREQLYCSTQEVVDQVLQDCHAEAEIVSISSPISLGAWCVYWWETFPSGFRVDLEHSQPQLSADNSKG